jgi:hypothetical protein
MLAQGGRQVADPLTAQEDLEGWLSIFGILQNLQDAGALRFGGTSRIAGMRLLIEKVGSP